MDALDLFIGSASAPITLEAVQTSRYVIDPPPPSIDFQLLCPPATSADKAFNYASDIFGPLS